jgi:hypothetical protein
LNKREQAMSILNNLQVARATGGFAATLTICQSLIFSVRARMPVIPSEVEESLTV